jgi:UDP-glucose 4-epimerase
MNILVTGGAGYIGSVVSEELVKEGYKVVVYDSLCKGHRNAVVNGAKFVEGDLVQSKVLSRTLLENKIDGVIHMAADSLVGESVLNPGKYYSNNLAAGLTLLEEMRKAEVTKIVFSSTAAVYGEPERQPIQENDPINPTNPYGETKHAFERALHWYDRAYGIRYVSLRYFNAAGATEFCGEHHDPETHLIPLVLQAASGVRPYIEIYGDNYPTPDGTCIRDYIHVADLARAHVLALSALDRSDIYNLGCGGAGYSVREVIDAAREITGRETVVRIGQRRAGDPAVLIASSEKIGRELGWSPRQQGLHSIIESAWRWMLAHPNGYEG